MVILGLGSNVGERAQHLQRAVEALKLLLTHVKCSPVYESSAMLPGDASAEWDMPFYNMAVRGETKLTPQALLAEVKAIEQRLGRAKRGHWAPREIDIDILAMGSAVVDEPDLVVPHPGLLMRDFALIPFAQLAPDWKYPVVGESHGKTAHVLVMELHSTLVKTSIVIA